MALDLAFGTSTPQSVPPTRSLKKPSFRIRTGSCTETGKRSNNEDSLCVDEKNRIFLVADGMGGQDDGEVASGIAATLIPELLSEHLAKTKDIKSLIQDVFKETNNAILAAGGEKPIGRRMGTTVVLAVEHRHQLFISGLGDSRAYLVRGENVDQLTIDHTLADALERNGDLSPEQAEKSPWKHVLYKFLGCPEMKDKPDVRPFTPQEGDRLILASDGVTNHITDRDLISGATAVPDPHEWAEALVKLALKRGSRDNLTCVVVAFEREEPK